MEHFLDLFLKNAPREEVKIRRGRAYFTDAKSIPIRQIETTAGTIKKVVMSEPFKQGLEQLRRLAI